MALPATFRTALALPLRRLMVMVLLPVVVVILGIFGYHFIEGWSYFDSLYMTVITLTTVGYAEIHDLSNAGRARCSPKTTSSRRTIQGPTGQNVSKPLPRVNWTSFRCRSRAVTSFTQV